MVFLKKKNLPKRKIFFFLPFFYATFQCGRYGVFKKKLKIFFTPKKWKNRPQKLLIIGPDHFFTLPSPGHSPQPRIDFSYYEISGPDICYLICVFNPSFYRTSLWDWSVQWRMEFWSLEPTAGMPTPSSYGLFWPLLIWFGLWLLQSVW